VAGGRQQFDAGRRQADAVFVHVPLARNADVHAASL
jgi:hypothetical protein